MSVRGEAAAGAGASSSGGGGGGGGAAEGDAAAPCASDEMETEFHYSVDGAARVTTRLSDDDIIAFEQFALQFLVGIFVEDEAERAAAFDEVEDHVMSDAFTAADALHLVFTLSRLAEDAPFDDIRLRCSELLRGLRERVPDLPQITRPGPSMFIPKSAFVSIDTADEPVRRVFQETFLTYAYVTNVIRVLGWFPDYLRCFRASMDELLRGDGPLPPVWRCYVVVLGAARHRCSYMMSFGHNLFLAMGGDAKWLQGINRAHPKLRKLASLNAYLAHRPWMLDKEFIGALARGDNAWTMSEIAHVIALLSTVHSLCCIVFGCGILSELKYFDDTPLPATPMLDDDAQYSGETEQLTLKLRSVDFAAAAEGALSTSPSRSGSSLADVLAVPAPSRGAPASSSSPAASSASEANGASASAPPAARTSSGSGSGNSSHGGAAASSAHDAQLAQFKRFFGSANLVWEDFSQKNFKFYQLNSGSWSMFGFPTLERFYSAMAQCLDQQFTVAMTMTDSSVCENRDVDTSPFRSAVWTYTQLLYGCHRGDVKYELVNALVSKKCKSVVKLLASTPELATLELFHNMGYKLRLDEKCHITILVAEARRQATMLYALRAMNDYITSTSSSGL